MMQVFSVAPLSLSKITKLRNSSSGVKLTRANWILSCIPSRVPASSRRIRELVALITRLLSSLTFHEYIRIRCHHNFHIHSRFSYYEIEKQTTATSRISLLVSKIVIVMSRIEKSNRNRIWKTFSIRFQSRNISTQFVSCIRCYNEYSTLDTLYILARYTYSILCIMIAQNFE